jgi:S1-C subfamily serine protease
MKKQTQLLSALALSVGLTLSASFQAVASIPGQVADQAPLPSLAPMLEKVLPAVVSVRVEGTASQGQKIPEEFKKFFGDDLPDQPAHPFDGLGSGVIIKKLFEFFRDFLSLTGRSFHPYAHHCRKHFFQHWSQTGERGLIGNLAWNRRDGLK